MKNMGDYHDHYLKKDVFDVYWYLLKIFELDPCHYFISTGLSWDEMLKITGEQTSDRDRYLFIEKLLRGGVSYIAKRDAKANNKYMNDYDSEKLWIFIT